MYHHICCQSQPFVDTMYELVCKTQRRVFGNFLLICLWNSAFLQVKKVSLRSKSRGSWLDLLRNGKEVADSLTGEWSGWCYWLVKKWIKGKTPSQNSDGDRDDNFPEVSRNEVSSEVCIHSSSVFHFRIRNEGATDPVFIFGSCCILVLEANCRVILSCSKDFASNNSKSL